MGRILHQGDQYKLPITLKFVNTSVTPHTSVIITPNNVDDVRIQVGELLKTYSENELTFQNNKWLYSLTAAQTLAIKSGNVSVQCEVKNGNDWMQTDVKVLPVGYSIIIEEDW